MRHFLVRRAAQTAAVVFVVVSITFALIRLAPGDPYYSSLEDPRVPREVVDYRRQRDGLDQPLVVQFGRFLRNVATGDLGNSISQSRPVGSAIRGALPNTLLLMVSALGASFVLGIAIGVLQAIRRGTFTDRALSAVSLFFYAMPDFWLALLMMLVFGQWLGLFPISGMSNPLMFADASLVERAIDRLYHLILPASTLALLTAAVVARYQRSAMLAVMHDDFVRTARAKGVPESRVVSRHALRNAMLPVITLLGLAFPALFGGAIFIETVFGWPGMGSLTVRAILARDYPLVVGAALTGALMVAAGSLLADVLAAIADPRLRET